MINIAGHTIDETLLGDGCIIDVGCRGFEFGKWFDKSKVVYCIDPDESIFENKPYQKNFVYLNVAISDKSGESGIYLNGEGTCLKEIDPDQSHTFVPCKTITMDDLYKITGENVDVLKLDCEGAEYIILGETFKPIPKQISVEFHHHCIPGVHVMEYPKIVERLSRDYVMVSSEWEQRHGCGFNFWDTLFVKK